MNCKRKGARFRIWKWIFFWIFCVFLGTGTRAAGEAEVIEQNARIRLQIQVNNSGEGDFYHEDAVLKLVADAGESSLKSMKLRILRGQKVLREKILWKEPEEPKREFEEILSAEDWEGDPVIAEFSAEDAKGEVVSTEKRFVFDKTPPQVKISFADQAPLEKRYFCEQRTMLIEVKDKTWDFQGEKAFQQVHIEAKDAEGKLLTDAWQWSAWQKAEKEGESVHRAAIDFLKDGRYRIRTEFTDAAGNIENGTEPVEFIIDREAPKGVLLAENDAGEKKSWTADTDQHEICRHSGWKFSTEGKDALSPQISVKYFLENLSEESDSGASFAEIESKDLWKEGSPPELRAPGIWRMMVRFSDQAGNTAYAVSDVLVVDHEKPRIFLQMPESSRHFEGRSLYSADVTCSVQVKEEPLQAVASGLKEIRYEVLEHGNRQRKIVQSGILFRGEKDRAISYWQGEIPISAQHNPSNALELVLYAADFADNHTDTSETGKSLLFAMDSRKPKISVEMDENQPIRGNVFSVPRRAYFRVTDQNFAAENTEVFLTRDGKRLTPSLQWKKESTHPDGQSTYVAEYLFQEEGHYSLSLASTDLAGNFEDFWTSKPGTVHAQDFIIDTVKPEISIQFAPGELHEGKYYRMPRTATVLIQDKNLIQGGVKWDIRRIHGGVEQRPPVPSEWEKVQEGMYASTIYFAEDGFYSVDLSVTDAANHIAVMPQETFHVDSTPPDICVIGVEDGKSYSAQVSHRVLLTDENYDPSEMELTLSRSMKKEKMPLPIRFHRKGGSCRIESPESIPSNDDIYEIHASLKDLAGNRTEKRILFSINRFGSRYELRSPDSFRGYLPRAEDIEISEKNPDYLRNQELVLFQNAKRIVLREGIDYKLVSAEDAERWKEYRYHIFAKNFSQDAAYNLILQSEDAADNQNSNQKGEFAREIIFGLDRTAPEIISLNVESDTTYPAQNLTASLLIRDNLILEKVLIRLDQNPPEIWEGSALREKIRKDSVFAVPISGKTGSVHSLEVIATDAAGNREQKKIENIRFENDGAQGKRAFAQVPWQWYPVIPAGLILGIWRYRRRKEKLREGNDG